MPPSKLHEIAKEHGEPLETLIPRVIEEEGSVNAATQKLGLSGTNIINWWLMKNGLRVERVIVARVVPRNNTTKASAAK